MILREFQCCDGASWVHVADPGHSQGIEVTLGRCSVCGQHWVSLFATAASSSSYRRADEATAKLLANMPEGRKARRLLEKMFDL